MPVSRPALTAEQLAEWRVDVEKCAADASYVIEDSSAYPREVVRQAERESNRCDSELILLDTAAALLARAEDAEREKDQVRERLVEWVKAAQDYAGRAFKAEARVAAAEAALARVLAVLDDPNQRGLSEHQLHIRLRAALAGSSPAAEASGLGEMDANFFPPADRGDSPAAAPIGSGSPIMADAAEWEAASPAAEAEPHDWKFAADIPVLDTYPQIRTWRCAVCGALSQNDWCITDRPQAIGLCPGAPSGVSDTRKPTGQEGDAA